MRKEPPDTCIAKALLELRTIKVHLPAGPGRAPSRTHLRRGVLLVLVLSACHSTAARQDVSAPTDTRFAPAVKTNGTDLHLDSIQHPDANTLLIAGPNLSAADLPPGTILLSIPPEEPVFAKVASVTPSGSGLLLHVVRPQLVEAFDEAAINEVLPIDLSSAAREGPLADRVTTVSDPNAKPPAPPDSDASSDNLAAPVNVALDGLVLFDSSVVDASGQGAEVELHIKSGNLQISPTALFELQKPLGQGIKRLTLGVRTKFKYQIEVEGAVTGTLAAFDWESAPLLQFGTVRVPFAYGWVALTARLGWMLHLEASSSSMIDGGVDGAFESDVGVVWEDGKWTPLATSPPTANGSGPTLSTESGLKVQTGPKLTMDIAPYDISGADVYLLPYLEMDGKLAQNPLRVVWQWLFGIEAGAEVKVAFLGVDLASYAAKVFDWSTVLKNGELPLGSPCQPDCGGHVCGPDANCGTSCGTCPSGNCSAGACVATTCAPNCSGIACGNEKCGISCGTCPAGFDCQSGQCKEIPCVPACGSLVCGLDPVCAQSCGACGTGKMCVSGKCKNADGSCEPDCSNAQCGDDGCGGSCGNCKVGGVCAQGLCVGGPCDLKMLVGDKQVTDCGDPSGSECLNFGNQVAGCLCNFVWDSSSDPNCTAKVNAAVSVATCKTGTVSTQQLVEAIAAKMATSNICVNTYQFGTVCGPLQFALSGDCSKVPPTGP